MLPSLRLGAAVVLEGDHTTRSAGRNSTYDVHLRSAATGVPVLTISARGGDRSSAISVPLHSAAGCDTVSNSVSPAETVREVFDAFAKPVVSAVVIGDEPLGTVVIDSAGAPRNRVAIGVLEHALSYIARSENVERAHASLVEVDSRGELVDVLDPASPHIPRIDENFDAQSVHIANATLLDVVPRHNRAKVARSLVPGKHCVCTVILRRRDGSLGSVTFVALQATGDSHKGRATAPQQAFRTVLQVVAEGLASDPIPPTLPFSRSKLTFLLKGVLCQTHPCAWIACLSPWYETVDDKETFADASTVLKSARAVAGLTDLATRAASPSPGRSPGHTAAATTGSSVSPRQQQQQPFSKVLQQHQHQFAAARPRPNADNDDADFDALSPASDGQQHHANQHPQQKQQNIVETPPRKTTKDDDASTAASRLASLASSPIPKENSLVPQPTAQPAPAVTGSLNFTAAATQPAPQKLIEPFRSQQQQQQQQTQLTSNSSATTNAHLETLVAQLQAQLRQSQTEQQQLKLRNLSLTTRLSELESRALRCEHIVAALHQHGKFTPLAPAAAGERSSAQQSGQPTPAIAPTPAPAPVAVAPLHATTITVSGTNTPPMHNNNNSSHLHSPYGAVVTAAFASGTTHQQNSNSGDQYYKRRASSQPRHLLSPAIELPPSAPQVQVPLNRSPSRESSSQPQYHHSQQLQQHQNQVSVMDTSNGQNVNEMNNTNTNNNSSSMITPNIWARSSVSRQPSYANQQQQEQEQRQQRSQYQQQQQQQTMRLPHANELVVVGYNFDLSEEEEAAVRREMEKRGIH